MPKICLYAEVLTHIRQLTLHATLETDGDETPRIDVSSDKQVITVVHGGESSSLWLPTQILGTANVTFLTPKKTELTARVQIEDAEVWKEFDQNSIEYPWDANELDRETTISCKTCRGTILSPHRITIWKDLPSQDWADVMDLWYCHKPHDHHDNKRQKSAAEAKGFSANSKLASHVGTGMVDLASFVLNPDDCNNLQIPDRSNENDFKPRSIFCSNCSTDIGTFSDSDNLIRMQKSDVIVQTRLNGQQMSFDASTFICAQLLALIESSPLRKVVVYSVEKDDQRRNRKKREFEHDGLRKSIQDASDENLIAVNNGTVDNSHHGDDASQLYSTNVAKETTARASTENTQQKESMTQFGSKYQTVTVEDAEDTGLETGFVASPRGRSSSTAKKQKSPDRDNLNRKRATAVEEDNESEGLLLWIFNPNIYYSSSLHPANITRLAESIKPTSPPPTAETASTLASETNPAPASAPKTPSERKPAHAHRAMKIFYKRIKNPTSYLQSQPTSEPQLRNEEYEDLALPSLSHLQNLITTLESSTQILPQNARNFQDWTVGLLDRYEKHPTAEEAMAQNPLTRRAELDLSEEDQKEGGGKGTVVLPAGYQELYL